MVIFDAIMNNSGLIYELITCFVFGGVGYFTAPILKEKIKKDGFQATDVTEAVSEGAAEYREALGKIESVIDDVTINNEDTLTFITDTIKKFKTFK